MFVSITLLLFLGMEIHIGPDLDHLLHSSHLGKTACLAFYRHLCLRHPPTSLELIQLCTPSISLHSPQPKKARPSGDSKE